MLFQHDYYTRSQREWNKARLEAEAEQKLMSPVEVRAAQLKKDEGWEKVVEAIRLRSVERKRVPSATKTEAFRETVERADHLAESLLLNIGAGIHDDEYGRIILTARQIIIDSAWKTDAREQLCALIAAADDLWIDVTECEGDKVVRMELSFDLTEAIE